GSRQLRALAARDAVGPEARGHRRRHALLGAGRARRRGRRAPARVPPGGHGRLPAQPGRARRRRQRRQAAGRGRREHRQLLARPRPRRPRRRGHRGRLAAPRGGARAAAPDAGGRRGARGDLVSRTRVVPPARRTRVVVLFGGRAVEREGSRISARTICGALEPARYEVIPRSVGRHRRFRPAAESARLLASGPVPERFRAAETAAAGQPTQLVPTEIGPGRADVVFPIIHGTTGEDGALQGFLETLGLPYVGAGVTASAVGMDKAVFKALLRDAGIPTTRAVVLRSARDAAAAAPLPRPVFVKPACGGSSVGVTKVKRAADLAAAVEAALRYDERALVEEGIDARELECAVLGNDDPRSSIPGEVVPGHEFYDYDDKYR